MRPHLLITAAVLLAHAASAPAADLSAHDLEFFESKVRPLLADRCYQCHSLEQNKSRGGLTLDTRQGWQKGGENGKVIEPGKPADSPLIIAIGYLDPDLQMPPKGEKLSDAEIAILHEWVQRGAPDPRDGGKDIATKLTGLTDQARHHWAYLPVKKPALPENKQQNWCKTPVDTFILQKLEAAGMTPNEPATKEALIRRAYYDLIGLPPTPYEVADFQKDNSPEAFAKVIDKLLASPHYGERWGRHWLDTARYSDTIGGERNNRTTDYRYPHAWTYRDYVIKSFNDDKPYTQFILEQLAADQLPGIQEDDPRLAALGFLTVGERFRNVNDIINDRIDTVSKGFLGLTVSCARCHDHMFDPIPQRDYYALHGVFASSFEPDNKPALPMQTDARQREDYEKKYAALSRELRDRYYDTAAHYLEDFWKKPEAYLKAALVAPARGRTTAADINKRNAIIREHKLDEQFLTYLSRGLIRNSTVWSPLNQARISGNFSLAVLLTADERANRNARRFSQRAEQQGGMMQMMAATIEAESAKGLNPRAEAALKQNPPKNLDELIAIYANLLRDSQTEARGLIAAMKRADSASIAGYDETLVNLLRGPFTIEPAPLMTKATIEREIAAWQPRMLARARLNFGELNLLEISHPGSTAKAMVVADRPRAQNSPLFIRGEAQSRGPIVPRGFLEILSPGQKPLAFTQGSGRLELAQAIADKENPLTARVAVNRIWMHHFGEGLVPTPDDLGVQAGSPSHPELLDYLAAKFMEFGWSVKQMHRLIMLSSVYQQSTATRADFEQIDPDNKLLWRANLRRLDFEAMRDSLLVFTGQLDRSLGGKPINLTDEPYSYRRSVYGYIDRGNLPELMQLFDFSDPDMPNSKRTSTVVPQQALFFMNSPMAVDIARKLVARPEIAKAGSPDEKTRWLYRILFQRLPSQAELALAKTFVAEVQASSETGPDVLAKKQSSRELLRERAMRQLPGNRNNSRFSAIRNEGETVERRPMEPWEAYAQALLFANELAYVN
jgi:mono/diheme cytochrome c family protein